MVILHVSGATAWGGNEQQLIDIIPALENLDITNLVFGVKDSILHKKCIENHITFICSNQEKLNKFDNYKFLKQIVLREKPNVIHLHTSNSVTVYVITDLLFRLKTPTVFSKKGMGNSMSWLSLYKYNYKNINAILCVSEAVKASMKKLVLKRKNHDKLHVVYDAVNNERFFDNKTYDLKEKYNISKEKLVVLHIGNHTKAKDLTTFVNTVKEVVVGLKMDNIHFIQIGSESKLTPDFENLIKEEKLADYISITGFLDEASSLISQADVFLITSEREGGPSSGLDAIYCKVPVVSTMVGVMPEIIKNKKSGLLSPVKDSSHIAKNLKFLVDNPNERKLYSDLAYSTLVKKFTSDTIAKETLNIYERILK